jgi:protein involved in polysaccharide export with SLBB domain
MAMLGLATACASDRQSPLTSSVAEMSAGTTIPEYRIQEGDLLSIHFFYTPELDTEQVVRADGMISLTYLSDQPATDQTIDQLRQSLVKAYAPVLDHPVITVSLKASTGGRVFIGGEVNAPGEIALVGRSSLAQMLIKAGGPKPTAAANRVVLIRREGSTLKQVAMVDAEALLNGDDVENDIRLRPYDVVYVPPSRITNVDRAVSDYVRQIVPVSFGASYSFQNLQGQDISTITQRTTPPTDTGPVTTTSPSTSTSTEPSTSSSPGS